MILPWAQKEEDEVICAQWEWLLPLSTEDF